MSLPRYTKNLFISNEKNIMRTINTYVDYTDVGGIFLNYNKERAKFQIHLEINNKKDIPDNCVHVYDISEAKKNRTSHEKIMEVLNNTNFKLLYTKFFLEKLLNLLTKYKCNLKNDFFDLDKDRSIKLIYNILDKQSIMVAKRVYSNILNRLIIKASINSLLSLKNKIKSDIEFYKEDPISKLDRIYKLKEDRNTKDRIGLNNIVVNYRTNNIIEAIDNYHNINHISNTIPNNLTLKDLINKKELNEFQNNINRDEQDIINNLNKIINKEIKSIFTGYIVILNYLQKNNKKFTSNTLTRMFNRYNLDRKHADKLTGRKRITYINTMKEHFGNAYDYISQFTDSKNTLKKVTILLELDKRRNYLNDEVVTFDKTTRVYHQTDIERLIDEGYITNLETRNLYSLDLDTNNINLIMKKWIDNRYDLDPHEEYLIDIAQSEANMDIEYQEYTDDSDYSYYLEYLGKNEVQRSKEHFLFCRGDSELDDKLDTEEKFQNYLLKLEQEKNYTKNKEILNQSTIEIDELDNLDMTVNTDSIIKDDELTF